MKLRQGRENSKIQKGGPQMRVLTHCEVENKDKRDRGTIMQNGSVKT